MNIADRIVSPFLNCFYYICVQLGNKPGMSVGEQLVYTVDSTGRAVCPVTGRLQPTIRITKVHPFPRVFETVRDLRLGPGH